LKKFTVFIISILFSLFAVVGVSAKTLNEIIDETIRYNNWQQARIELDAYTKANPNDADAFGLYAVALSQLKNYDEAIRACRTAINLEKSDEKKGEYYYNLGTFYYNMGVTDVAVSMYDKSIALNTMLAQPYYMLGLINFDKKDFDQCISYWTQYMSLCENDIKRAKIREAIGKIQRYKEAEAERIEQERRQAEEEAERKRIAAEEAKRRQEEYLQNLKDELSDTNKEATNLSDYKIEESVEEAEFEGLD
jgi:tetratricopeptide (TPR) repeat protein